MRTQERTTVEETELVAPDDRQTFSRTYARWLKARAAIRGDDYPEDEKAAAALFAEERAALRELFSLRARDEEEVWHKIGAFEVDLVDELVLGETMDAAALLALGSIKNDLINLGIGNEAPPADEPTGEPDPVFALIEAHRVQWAMLGRLERAVPYHHGECVAAKHQANVTMDRLLRTSPMTLAGAKAVISYLVEWDLPEDSGKYFPALAKSPIFFNIGAVR
jgi:hypothetical protein